MTPIVLPHPTDPSWTRAEAIADRLILDLRPNPFIVAALVDAYAESAWRGDVAGDHGQSCGPWQMKAAYYRQPILSATGIDVLTERDLALHTIAVQCALGLHANGSLMQDLVHAMTSKDATWLWSAHFERASAGDATQRRMAVAPQMSVWLAGYRVRRAAAPPRPTLAPSVPADDDQEDAT